MLMQMSQVGRDQAVEKDGPILQAAIQGAISQKREVEANEGVRRPEEPKDGSAPVKDRQGGKRGRGKGGEAETENAEEGSEEGGEEVVRDPSLGNRVDLTG
jgi:hypothetical protein